MQKNEKRRKNPYKIIFEKNDNVKWLIVILIISIFTGLITPLGTTPYTYLIKTLEGNTTQNISEHQPLTLIKNKPMLIVFFLYLMILTFTDTKIKLRDLFMLSGLTLLSFMSRRQTSMFVIICGVIFAKLLTNLIQKYDKKGSEDFIKFASTILGKILIITIVLLLSVILYRVKIKDKFINEKNYPIGAAEYILTNFDVNNIRIFNEYNYGSYLIFRGIPVFIDSRADLYAIEFNGKKNAEGKYEGKNIFSDYIKISNINSHYEKNFEKYGITHVLVRKRTKLNMLLSKDKNYKELYVDSNFVFYDRLSK